MATQVAERKLDFQQVWQMFAERGIFLNETARNIKKNHNGENMAVDVLACNDEYAGASRNTGRRFAQMNADLYLRPNSCGEGWTTELAVIE